MMITLRNISCAGALIALLSLERSMLGSYGDASDQFSLLIQAGTGAVAVLIMVGLGIHMIVLSFRKKRERDALL